MAEYRGLHFRRVLEYGRQKVAEFSFVDKELALRNHVRSWICAARDDQRRLIDERTVEVEWIIEGGDIVGVRSNV